MPNIDLSNVRTEKGMHEVMRYLAPKIMESAVGEGGHGIFVKPTEISSPDFSAQAILADDDGVNKLMQFLVAFKLTVRAMGCEGAVSWVAALDGTGATGRYTFYPAN